MQKIRIFLFSFDDDVLLPLESCSTGIYIYIYIYEDRVCCDVFNAHEYYCKKIKFGANIINIS